ncbi:aldehyde dehydrogenase family protein [Pseudogemmobacter sonorensis]|uniref:aldehyde dehydrogenase family protein n=1 Tax=Pseudogemmobacter sonorensis TaxID=2989681 RepID=UPI00369F3878
MTPEDETAAARLHAGFAAARAAHLAAPMPPAALRIDRLRRLEAALLAREEDLVAAMRADFGHRSAFEARVFDVTFPLGEIRSNRRHLRRWMRARRVGMPLYLWPARGRVLPQPKGVAGVIAPWNFPVYLTLAPVAAALAAGNRVLVKPSELTPRTSALLARMVEGAFAPDELSVHPGGVELARAFADLPFDHLLFTGSTRVGRQIAQAAARNLVPVTLELGGKSPAILGLRGDMARAARRIAFGKVMNAGQVCVSPDYALVPRARVAEFADLVAAAIAGFFPQGPASPDFTAILTDDHLARLHAMLDEARARGAGIREILPPGAGPAPGRLTPTLVLDPPLDGRLMREEIFGPILPILPYDSPEEARAMILARPVPLALYLFTEDRAERAFWLEGTRSGGVCVNETVFHVAAHPLPFGGLGESGMGAYHGRTGFDTFSHLRPVLDQPRLNGGFLFDPPGGRLRRIVAQLLRRMV